MFAFREGLVPVATLKKASGEAFYIHLSTHHFTRRYTVMTELSEFSLGPSSSALQKWFGNNSQLFRDGIPIPFHLEGGVLRHQFHTSQGYLFITDYDCPFEEITHITLCTHDFHLLSRRSFMGLFNSYSLDRMECLDHERLLLDFGPKHRWLLSLRPRGFPYLRSRIQLSRVRGKTSEFAKGAAC